VFIPTNRAARRKALSGLRSLRNDATGIGEVKALVQELQNKLKAKDAEVQALIDKANADVKAHGVTLDATKAELADAVKKGLELQTQATEAQGRLVAIEQKLVTFQAGGGATKRESAGQKFTENEKIKAALAEGSKFKGRISVVVNTITELTSGDGGAGDIIIPQRIQGIITPPNRTLRIRDLLPKGRTVSNALDFVQESGFTNAAAMVAEGAQKPESSLSFELASAPVRTLAHWIKATRQVLDDVPQLQSYIDTRLRYGLELVEETQLLVGDGTGQNILGLIPQATPYDTNRSKVGDTRIDIIRRAMTQLRLAEFAASAIVMHPTDWEEIELLKDTLGDYIWSNPRGLAGPTLWGLPVLDSTSLTEGEFLVGAFNIAAQIWDRQDATVEISTEDQDNFIRNLVTIRAEERLALTVYRPESFIYGDFDQDVST
jgi:HK97 family phage major capsid protein